MDILNELAEKFTITLDSELCNDSSYLKAMAQLHELSEGLPAEKATELDDIAAALTSAAFNAGVRSGLKLGARITVGLIGSEKMSINTTAVLRDGSTILWRSKNGGKQTILLPLRSTY